MTEKQLLKLPVAINIFLRIFFPRTAERTAEEMPEMLKDYVEH